MSDWRMDAYYYGFEPTGVEAIDRILSAIACAGKAFHHTEDWNEEATPREHLRGKTPKEWIQNAANDAASLDETERLSAALTSSADYLEAGFKNKLDPEAFGKALEVIRTALSTSKGTLTSGERADG